MPHAENQTLSDFTCKYTSLWFSHVVFHSSIEKLPPELGLPAQWVTFSLCLIPFVYVHVCVSSTVDRWWRWGFVQSGWWQNTVHWPDPIGGVLPAKPWGVALQTQTSLCPDHPVNKGTPEGQHNLDSEAFLDKHSQCFCALKKKDMHTNREAMLSETTVVHVVAHGPLFYFSLWEKSEFDNRLYSNRVHVLRMTCSCVW